LPFFQTDPAAAIASGSPPGMQAVSSIGSAMISCLTVTRETRFRSLELAVGDFARQTWAERELVIVHDGDAAFDAKLKRLAAAHDAAPIAVHRTGPGQTLGDLRNA
jgi:hypothetical protein